MRILIIQESVTKYCHSLPKFSEDIDHISQPSSVICRAMSHLIEVGILRPIKILFDFNTEGMDEIIKH